MPDLATTTLNRLGIPFESLVQIVHEDALSSLVYCVELKNENRCILKLSHNADRYRRETFFLSLLEGVIPVPKVIALATPEKGFSGAIVMEEVQGVLLNRATMTEDEAFQLGAILATVHNQKTTHYGDLTKPSTEKRDDLKPDQHMKAYFEESLEECKDIVPKALLEQCIRHVESHLGLLHKVDGPCIVHRDYRPGNAIAHKGTIQAIIDFENTKSSFAEEDFVLIEHLVWTKYPQTKDSFMDGYASVRPLPHLDEILPFLRIIKAIGAIGFTADRGTWQTKHSHVYKDNLAFLKNSLIIPNMNEETVL